MSIWNQIVNAAYRNEWQLAETAVSALPDVRVDDANNLAEVFGHIIGERLHRRQAECLTETVTWLTRQPYLNQTRFAEWVTLDALKNTNSALHRRVAAIVTPLCTAERIRAIGLHLAECAEQDTRSVGRNHFEAVRKAVGCGRVGVFQLACNDTPALLKPESTPRTAGYCTVQ